MERKQHVDLVCRRKRPVSPDVSPGKIFYTEGTGHSESLRIAERCATLLRTQFGVQRVIFFGSLVGHGPWHDQSDIDIAVEGLAPSAFFQASSACERLLPPGLKLDLVRIEDVWPEMRARILEEVVMSDQPGVALKELIDDELVAIDRTVEEMRELCGVCAHPPTRTELRAMGSLLQEFYTGVERMFERIAVQVDGEVPRGEQWHKDLLTQMTTAQEGVRPAVIDAALWGRLEVYLKFRHFFRQAYGTSLLWGKVSDLVEGMKVTCEEIKVQMAVFGTFLTEPRGQLEKTE